MSHGKSHQIESLLESIQSLNALYSQMNTLVIDQGTILDRIDVNIDSTLL